MGDDRLTYWPARWKALLKLGFGGALVWFLFVQIDLSPARQSNALAVVFAGVMAAWLLWEAAAALLGGREVAFSREGVLLTAWGRARSIAWKDVESVDVFQAGGAQMLSIKVRGRRRMMLTHGWNAHPDEIVADLQVRRAEWEGRGVPPGTDESERDVRWRNRMRRLGMGAVIAGGAITFLNLGGIRQMGPDERPADLEFQWAVAPTEFQIAMFVLGLLVTAWGAWRWLWFTGTPARPPILATLQERLVFALGGLVQGIGVMMIMDWLNHPR